MFKKLLGAFIIGLALLVLLAMPSATLKSVMEVVHLFSREGASQDSVTRLIGTAIGIVLTVLFLVFFFKLGIKLIRGVGRMGDKSENAFDYWVKTDRSRFIMFYWSLFSVAFILGAWLSLKFNNPFMFLIISFLPYPLIFSYRVSHNPMGELEAGIKKYDQNFYDEAAGSFSDFHFAGARQKGARLLNFLLLKSSDKSIDSHLLSFKKNYHRVNKSAMLSLSLWFFTFMALLFGLFFARH